MDSYTASRLRRRRSGDPLPLLIGLGSVLALVIAGVVYWKVTEDQKLAEATQAKRQQQAKATAPAPAPATTPAPAPSRQPAETRPAASQTNRLARAADREEPSSFNGSGSSSYQFSSTNSGPPRDAGGAVDRIAAEVRDSLALRKALVVWVFDRSASNEPLRKEVIDRLGSAWAALYDEAGADAASADPSMDDAKLLSTVVAYGDSVDFLLQDPTGDANVFSDALARVKTHPSHVENTFEAIRAATETYLSYRAQKGRNVTIVVVTDEVGDDATRIDEVLPPLTRYSIPVHVIGISASFGRADGMAVKAEGGGDDSRLPLRVVQGPESRDLDWVNLDFPRGRESLPDLPAGIGPYALSRLCLETSGTYFALPQLGEGLRMSAVSTSAAATGPRDGYDGAGYWASMGAASSSTPSMPSQGSALTAGPVDPNFVRRYMPRYMSEQQYQQEFNSNRALKALVEAAKLPRVEVFTSSGTSFAAEADEGRRARAFDTAQRPAARVLPAIDALYNVLKTGEPDRPKLTDPRQQAAFDLAMGRAMAAKVRADGFINMVAVLKNGKNFENESSTTWVIEPANELKIVSALDKMSQRAIEYLEGVIKNHPGTPWAEAAYEELQVPIGWRLVER